MSNIYDYQSQTPPSGDGQNPPQPAQGTQGQGSDVAGMWRNWIGDPSNRAALMQFGISLMQPISPGQNTLGHVGEALGSAGEAVARKRAIDLKEQEAASKADLREAQAIRSEAGARELSGTAAAREAGAEAKLRQVDTAGQMLTLREALGSQKTGHDLAKAFYEAKLINPSLTLEEYKKTVGEFTPKQQFPLQTPQAGGPTQYPTGSRPPQVGDVVRGYRYKGGPLNNPTSWEPAQ